MTLEDRYSCGEEFANNYKDCSIASTKDNSCCYYEGNDLKRCYWLGIKYTGKASKHGYDFVCDSKFLYNKIILIFFGIITNFNIFL